MLKDYLKCHPISFLWIEKTTFAVSMTITAEPVKWEPLT